MAARLDAILNIAAKVTGQGAIAGITGAVQKLESTSKVATGTLRNLAGSAGGLGGALGMLAPALSVGGLVGLATNSIKGADAMNDLSQKTGVSVEALARFKKAASVSGTDIEGVSKALVKLSKGMFDAANTGKGPASEAFKTLGISATDASGKLKSSEQVMLEVANRFKTMPDGAEKTAIALQLFGKAGADMIPMLNMGGEAIDKMSSKMTTAFAKKADEYSDKLAILQGKIGGIGTSIAIALLPALDLLANVLTTVVDLFTKLPGPLQAIVGAFALLAISLAVLAPLFVTIGAAVSAIAASGLAATIAGWAGALIPLLGSLGALGQLLVAIFTGPVGWVALLVAAGVALFAFRKQIGDFLVWVGKGWSDAFSAIGNFVGKVWQGIAGGFDKFVMQPLKAGLRGIAQFAANAMNGVIVAINQVIGGINRARAVVGQSAIGTVGLIQVPAFATGGVVSRPTLAMVGEGGQEYIIPASKMAAASANYLAGSRGASVLSGGRGVNMDNWPESLRSKMLEAYKRIDVSANQKQYEEVYKVLNARRKLSDLPPLDIPAWVKDPIAAFKKKEGASAGVTPQINITTGPVMQTADGQQWVSMADLERAQRQTVASVLGQLRTPAGRYAMGTR
jgi:hypothetical protein